jgi:hypothetical protein
MQIALTSPATACQMEHMQRVLLKFNRPSFIAMPLFGWCYATWNKVPARTIFGERTVVFALGLHTRNVINIPAAIGFVKLK